MSESPSSISSCRILWSTQSGRAKACARRTARILGEKTSVQLDGGIGCPFDETPVPFLELLASNSDDNGTLFLMFVSTTGDGEQCDTIQSTWKSLLQKSLPRNLLANTNHRFALFCLGDRAYGPQFCAAGRKLAVRLLQLGMKSSCEVGYGDDNTPNGGVFRDLDVWLEDALLPTVSKFFPSEKGVDITEESSSGATCCPFRVQLIAEKIGTDTSGTTDTTAADPDTASEEVEWKSEFFVDSYRDYFTARGPITAYSYVTSRGERIIANGVENSTHTNARRTPFLGRVTVNDRITASDWKQDTRHLEICLSQQPPSEARSHFSEASGTCGAEPTAPLPYMAGDVASILPFNSKAQVDRFFKVLPDSIASLADSPLQIDLDESYATDNRFTRWPRKCTLRGWLTYCADIQSLLEREDLRALSAYCAPGDSNEDSSLNQSEKLKSLSETSEAALYADYILREKRSWIDVLYDFESLREPGSRLTIEGLLMLLPPMRTRDFSIASSPTMETIRKDWNTDGDGKNSKGLFSIELCIAVVEGTTRLGREYHGLCSKFLSEIKPITADDLLSSELQVWIRPGTFGKMPTQLSPRNPSSFEVPIICVGAGTGVAPMRSLILERVALRALGMEREKFHAVESDFKKAEEETKLTMDENDNILLFGCRKKQADYYYKDEWQTLKDENNIRLLTAFSQDQAHKMYVQKRLREGDDGTLIARHILERGGAVFIAGGPKMARAVKQEIVEALTDVLPGGEKQANKILTKLQRIGRFSIEAWS